jgi:hypothetical protein
MRTPKLHDRLPFIPRRRHASARPPRHLRLSDTGKRLPERRQRTRRQRGLRGRRAVRDEYRCRTELGERRIGEEGAGDRDDGAQGAQLEGLGLGRRNGRGRRGYGRGRCGYGPFQRGLELRSPRGEREFSGDGAPLREPEEMDALEWPGALAGKMMDDLGEKLDRGCWIGMCDGFAEAVERWIPLPSVFVEERHSGDSYMFGIRRIRWYLLLGRTQR